MKPKGPPYNVVHGRPNSEPPPYVEAVFANHFTFGGNPELLRQMLEKAGLISKLEKDRHGRPSMSFGKSAGPLEDDPGIQNLFSLLNCAGLKFSYDQSSPAGPSGIIAALQEREVLNAAYEEIAWAGPGKWFVTTHDVEAA